MLRIHEELISNVIVSGNYLSIILIVVEKSIKRWKEQSVDSSDQILSSNRFTFFHEWFLIQSINKYYDVDIIIQTLCNYFKCNSYIRCTKIQNKTEDIKEKPSKSM